MKFKRIDHVVLKVEDLQKSVDFYERIFGMRVFDSGNNQKSLFFDNFKISLHQFGLEYKPKPTKPTPGSGDFCLIAETPLNDVINHIEACGVKIVLGPVRRAGAGQLLLSVYIYDPDMNLIEIANEVT